MQVGLHGGILGLLVFPKTAWALRIKLCGNISADRLPGDDVRQCGVPARRIRRLARLGNCAVEASSFDGLDILKQQVTAALAQGSRFIAAQAFSLGLDTFAFVARLGVTLYLSFFLIRDGDELARMAQMALPIPPQFKQELLRKFMTVVRATVRGSLLVAAIQGTLGGIAFWFLDVKGALLWAVLMAYLSLLQMIGASLVWMPVAVYFLLAGTA